MRETIYNDFIPLQKDIKKAYKGKIKKIDDVEDLIYDEHIIEYFALFFDDLYEIFKYENYAPKKLEDANNYLMQNYYELGKSNEIAGVYTKKINGKEKEFITKINKTNFYHAYYMPIWKKLGLKERAQVLKWHFDYKKEKFALKNLKLRLIEHEDYISCNQNAGMCMDDMMYVNNNLLFDENPFDLITTLEHEFQHINENLNYNYFIKSKKQPSNLYEKLIVDKRNGYFYPANLTPTKDEKEGLYLGYIMEQKAEKKALKEYLRYNKANQEFFGICKEQEKSTKEFIWNMKFRNGLLSLNAVKKSDKYTTKEIQDYEFKQKIIKNSDYLIKMKLLRAKFSEKICALLKEERNLISSGKEFTNIKRMQEIKQQKSKYQQVIKQIDNNYKQVLRNGGKKLPESVFSELELSEK